MLTVLSYIALVVTVGASALLVLAVLLYGAARALVFFAYLVDRMDGTRAFVRLMPALPRAGREFHEQTRSTARELGWVELGVYEAARGAEVLDHSFWLAPTGDALLVARAVRGRLATVTRWSVTSRLPDGRVLSTQNSENLEDFAGLWEVAAFSPITLPDLIDKHRNRLAAETASPELFPAAQAVQTYHELAIAREERMATMGLLRFRDPAHTQYRFTLRGACKAACGPCRTTDPRSGACWIRSLLPPEQTHGANRDTAEPEVDATEAHARPTESRVPELSGIK